MNLLFVHQNGPGQYRQIVEWLAARNEHRIVFLTQRTDFANVKGVSVVTYRTHYKMPKDGYGLTRGFADCAGAGYGAAMACKKLKEDGFIPDVILGHIGWGELTFVKLIWPDVPVIGYLEYYYLTKGGSVGFDPEYQVSPDDPFIQHARNAINHLNLTTIDLGQSPTHWQFNTYPEEFRAKAYVCHDGIRTDRLGPDPRATLTLARLNRAVTRDDEIFTYMARNMEPTRGFHIFMRSLPDILNARPKARVLILGGNGVSYSRHSDVKGGYRAEMQRELGDKVDWSRVHFLGMVPYGDYLRVIQLSRCHIYLTVPFVVSWSLIEAMAMQATIVASDTAPVREILRHGETAMLVDFLSPKALAKQVVEVLERPADFAHLGPAARAHAVAEYDFLTRTLEVHLEQINSLVPRAKRISLSAS